MHIRIAVDAVSGSSPRMLAARGFTAAAGSRQKRMIKNPMVAFQNPRTDQGKVTVNSTRKAMPPALYGGTATIASHKVAAIVAVTSTANSVRRRTRTVVNGPSAVAESVVTRSSIALTVPLLSCPVQDIPVARPQSPSEIRKVPDLTAEALWYV